MNPAQNMFLINYLYLHNKQMHILHNLKANI